MVNLSCPRDKVKPEMSDAESVSLELVRVPSRTITAITAAFCFVVRKATVDLYLLCYHDNILQK